MTDILEEAAFRAWAAGATHAERKNNLRMLWAKVRISRKNLYRRDTQAILSYIASLARERAVTMRVYDEASGYACCCADDLELFAANLTGES